MQAGWVCYRQEGAAMTDSLQQLLDDWIVKYVASGCFTDVDIHERAAFEIKDFYGIDVSLNLIRKRLWNLSLRHIIYREKNSSQRYFLHPISKQQTLKKILHGQPDALTCPLCDNYCWGSKKCKLGFDTGRINCETNTHWDFSGEE